MLAPVELLSILERPVRGRIPAAIDAVHRSLDDFGAFAGDPARQADRLAQCFNMAALIELHFGRPDRARALCRDQLAWIAGLVARRGLRDLAAFALQPWVNLARLDRLAGDAEQADTRLDALLAARERRDVAIGEVEIAAADWAGILLRRPDLDRYLISVWACEQLLIALRCRRFDALDRVDRALCGVEECGLRLAAAEARMIAECLPNGPGAARVDGLELPESVSELQVHALALRRFAVKVRRGRPRTREMACEQVRRIAGRQLAAEAEPWRLAVLQHALALLADWNAVGVLELAEAGYGMSRGIGDEILVAWFAEAGMEASAGAAIWVARRDEARRGSWYAALRVCGEAEEAERARQLDALADRLRALA